jgi:hypothetical protein
VSDGGTESNAFLRLSIQSRSDRHEGVPVAAPPLSEYGNGKLTRGTIMASRCVALATVIILVLSGSGRADPLFMTQISLLKSKSEQCIVEIKRTGKSGRFCDDFSSYSDYVFKGDSQSYMHYHLSNGDITDRNSGFVLATLKGVLEAVKLTSSSTQ